MNSKFLLGLVFSLSLLGCSGPVVVNPTPPDTVTPIICVSKLERKLNFTYHPENAVQYRSSSYNVNIYVIETVDGQKIVVNSLELQNFTCSRPFSDK